MYGDAGSGYEEIEVREGGVRSSVPYHRSALSTPLPFVYLFFLTRFYSSTESPYSVLIFWCVLLFLPVGDLVLSHMLTRPAWIKFWRRTDMNWIRRQ